MKIKVKTLRRAETELLSEIQLLSGRLPSFSTEPLAKSLNEARSIGLESYKNKLSVLQDCITAKYDIRNSISKFNQANGINDRTLKIAVLTEQLDLIEKSHTRINDASANRSYYGDIEGYNIGCSQSDLDQYRVEVRKIKKEIQGLKDSCNGINASNDVEITTELHKFLTDLSMI